jgi:NYN domain
LSDPLRTIVFVDGYNLYYGMLRRSPYKWLNLFALFRDGALDARSELLQVRYYTAPVLGKMCDDPASPARQRTYLQALRRMHPDNIQIIEGQMVASKPFQRLVQPIAEAPHLEMVQTYAFNEKKTDVNMAADMMAAAWTNACEQIVLCSNDSDMQAALSTIRTHCPQITLGLVAPIPGDDHRRIAQDLEQHAHWSKTLKRFHLGRAQLPDKIPGTAIHKPAAWNLDA